MRFARFERPLLTAGLALITIHLLDLALSGPDTSLIGVAAIVAVPLAALWAQPRVTRPTRAALGVMVGLLFAAFGIASHGLHAVLQGPGWFDVTGLGAIAGGLLLMAGGVAALFAPGRRDRRHRGAPPAAGLGGAPGVAALFAPGRRDRRHRVAHAAAWLVGAIAMFALVVLPLGLSLMI